MAHEIDWINSKAGMCNITSYKSKPKKEDSERKMVCFVNVANLNTRDGNLGRNVFSDQPDHINDPAGELDLRNLEEKEVIVIKDNERRKCMNTDGAVCLFKPGSLEDVNIVNWLNNDLQKYAFGFEHALTPFRTSQKLKVFDKGSQNNNNMGSSSSMAGNSLAETGNSEDLAYYANKLCSLVVEMTRKEIKDRWENTRKYLCQNINSYNAGRKASLTESKPSSEDEGKEQEGQYDSTRTRRSEDCTSVNKGLMLYANQVASDMMLSFLKTMSVQKGRHPPAACVVLKDVLVNHAKEIVSDLIDSSMKNLHNITGALMKDSDFICGVKKNLFSVGSQKSTEVLEAMVRRLFKLLAGDDKTRAQSLAFTSCKLGALGNQRTQGMQFASLKSECHSQGKDRMGGAGGPGKPHASGSRGLDKQVSADVYGKEILLTALMQIQQHLLEKTKKARIRENHASSCSYLHHDSTYDRSSERSLKRSSKSYEGRPDCDGRDKGSVLLSVIQKVLQEIGFNPEDLCMDKNRG
ncbi:A-kinase anchor protein 4-like [Pseudonaja textilis]|uniref:A-kinase anchor protein 4-like n=1 Tax=Pseudonaja textilis TaxID=8673 RepID=UPI000EA87F5E|nr:A-kinase anchor protein 4-like [Pseudonaja textilis]